MVGNEFELRQWFLGNYRSLGFEEIIEDNIRRSPDLVMLRNGNLVRVELETHSYNFINHGHYPLDVDLVICINKNASLPIPIMELNPRVILIKNETVIIRISKNTRRWLDSLKIHPRQSYAEIWDKIKILLIKDKTLKEKLNGIKI